VSKRKTERFLNIQTKENEEEEIQDKNVSQMIKILKILLLKKLEIFLKILRVKHQLIIFDNTF